MMASSSSESTSASTNIKNNTNNQQQQTNYEEKTTQQTLNNLLLNNISSSTSDSQQQKLTSGGSGGASSSTAAATAVTSEGDCTFKLTGLTATDIQNMKLTGDNLKKNPKLDFNKSELLKLLCYLEGELQARDVVIATLKSEKIKYLINGAHTALYKPIALNDPNAALFRDNLANYGNTASYQTSTSVTQTEHEMRIMAEQQMESLENLIMKQRRTQLKIINVLKDADDKYKRVTIELDEEKRKHEHDTAQGDDITYGLEIERTHLKQELETEKGLRKKAERELKKVQELLDAEKTRQKQIVLLLLAERKKIIMKYIEERKRSEDLSQILSEEKLRVDTIAEGLEEESKKSLRMEAEMEKQLHQFEIERKALKANVLKEDKKVREQELEIAQLRTENEMLRNKQSRSNISQTQSQKTGFNVRSTAVVSDSIDDPSTNPPMMSSVAKVVQPTATATSVPVSGPTTGIARSISPGHSLRHTASSSPSSLAAVTTSSTLSSDVFNTTKVTSRKINPTGIIPSVSGAGAGVTSTETVGGIGGTSGSGGGSNSSSSGQSAILSNLMDSSSVPRILHTSGTILKKSNDPNHTSRKSSNVIGTTIPATTDTLTNNSTTTAAIATGTSTAIIPPPPTERGVPPPIPPNKPIIPPKRDGSTTRLSGIISGAGAANIAINTNNNFKDKNDATQTTGNGGSSNASNSNNNSSDVHCSNNTIKSSLD